MTPVMAKMVRFENALRSIASEPCTYSAHEGDRDKIDPGCPGEVCTARQALA